MLDLLGRKSSAETGLLWFACRLGKELPVRDRV
jgi:hypothetical protein